MSRASPKRDLLSITDVAAELPSLLDRALAMKRARARGDRTPTRPGANLALIFEKPSTRTRASFEVAASDLGGRGIYFAAKDMQLGRGETIGDTARVLSRYVDAIAYRAFRHEDEIELARHASVPVINALDDREHPCQILADLLTLKERWPDGFRGKRLAYIGDGNNVLHSLLLGCAISGLDLATASPAGYDPAPDIVELARKHAATSGARLTFTRDPREAAKGSDGLYTDVWVSMGDEAQKDAREKAFHGFQINDALLRLAAPDAWVLHDLPAHRGLEITDEVMDGPRAAIWDQAENRLHAQKAVLELLLPAPSGSAPA
ncbi:MAG: ornithine carbamoyltransferase [Thermoplasmata archaeon]|nr:ornithine carbamoyltransferase [Thermoplasmata archaeon]